MARGPHQQLYVWRHGLPRVQRRTASVIFLAARHFHESPRAQFLFGVKKFFNRNCQIPTTKKVENTAVYFGRVRKDEYKWMEDGEITNIIEYLNAERQYTNCYMKDTKGLQRSLVNEMRRKCVVNQVLPSLTTRIQEYEYYTEATASGPMYYRRQLGQGKAQLLLDSGELAKDGMSVRKVGPSPEHKRFAYLVEQNGMEYGTLYISDLGRDPSPADVIENVFNFAWSGDERTVYYTKPDDQLRPFQVFAHQIGRAQEDDLLVYQEDDSNYFLDVSVTKDHQYVTINANSLGGISEVMLVDAFHDFERFPKPKLQIVEPRSTGIEYYVDHHENQFFIVTNADDAVNFKVVRAPNDRPNKKYWRDLISIQPDEKIDDVDIFKNFIVIYGKRQGLSFIKSHDLSTNTFHEIPLPEEICVASPGFTCYSPFSHEATYDYDMKTHKFTYSRIEDIYNFNRNHFTCTRTHATSADGKKIPITLISKKGLKRDGRNPVQLHVYGAYGANLEPVFRIETFPLLDRGWIIGLAHVRGGGELGRNWYEDGKLMRKHNSFNDFVAATEHLIHEGYTSPKLMTAIAASAGGLVLGTVLNRRPDLFRAMILRVPFVDPLSCMLNPNLPLTQVEYTEWGNPLETARVYQYLSDYAPYDNIPVESPQLSDMPAILVTTGLRDQRVPPWQPLKWTARLRSRIPKFYDNPEARSSLLLKAEDGGHFGASNDQQSRIEELAFELAFLLKHTKNK
ncbi:prolyl oligopeptidase [Basidiobolus meristosporus CBS 931.73]|uniref:Prolyl endopeptidase n=1 Tax=Basidiobolus meristosporus CBS 931.73 TaxID=1314790 RepID=A0A1Y1XU69_9FUNG|nr:prolyl oligopeptidase [Basidiobolus meristosporus CBS 931.73]|eukprot:ORX88834.1 prolyl oligopeptidase [Basidiobolus meristosporus CBS 931.73]